MADVPEFHLFLPQMRMSMPAMIERARAAEAAGFTGLALMDHLAPPMAEQHDMWDAMINASWLLAATDRLKVSHLVLCDAMRHPAVLSKQAVTLDHASGGRFELGIGWGSVPEELRRYGVSDADPRVRVDRFAETLEVLQLLWTGEPISYDGQYHHIDEGVQNPKPLGRIPIIIGGAGPKTVKAVATHADWWNCPINKLDKVDELRDRISSARISTQQMASLIPSEAQRDEVTALTAKRFGRSNPVIGTTDELLDHYRREYARGIERFYVWFCDFAAPETLTQFGDEVIGGFG